MTSELNGLNVALIDFFGRDPLELWLLGGFAAVLIGVLGRALWRRRAMRAQAAEIDPYLVFSRESVSASPLNGLVWAPPATDSDEDDESFQPTSRVEPFRRAQVEPAPMQPAPLQPAVGPPVAPFPSASRMGTPYAPVRPAWSAVPPSRPEVIDEASQTIRLPTNSDGTIQLLPGTLVMVEGPEVGREYRFLRMEQQASTEVTVGRASGHPYHHLQLPVATVSRMHARLRYEDGGWRVVNLSTTNPLLINGRELGSAEEVVLVDGDRIRLGEVELAYSDQRQ